MAWIVATALALALAGCGGKESYQRMAATPRYEPFEPSDFFVDGSSARALPAGTVARGHLDDDALLARGLEGEREAEVFPFPVTLGVLRRGQERFSIYCVPCHGATGYGDGIVPRRGFTSPPSFHDPRLRAAPAGHFVHVMTEGFGAMPQYAKQIAARDRWAIAAYIRALQLSQHASLADVPPDGRAALERPR